jgi:hypothetical protein
MSRNISENIRLLVATRAGFCCEYCKIHELDLHFAYHIDHILSVKHGGDLTLMNLAYACSMCNQNKGSDLGTYINNNRRLTRFFNPRTDKWNAHFEAINGEIIPKTNIAIATIKILDLNHPDRIILRRVLTEIGSYTPN